MVADLAVLVPSRGRPEGLKRLVEAVRNTRRGTVHVIAGVDQDDPRCGEYLKLFATCRDDTREPDEDVTIITSDQRRTLVDWTNRLAGMYKGQYRYFASLGDDMVPRTTGWDVKLTSAIEEDFGGTGIVYPWDAIRDDIPEAYVLSSDIVQALGWMMMPSLKHFWNDNVWADIGHRAQCIRQLRGVIVDHLNVGVGKAPVDQTALDNGTKIADDQVAYLEWRKVQMHRDVEIVRKLRGLGDGHGPSFGGKRTGPVIGNVVLPEKKTRRRVIRDDDDMFKNGFCDSDVCEVP
jgi:hypothetical protein